MVSYYVGERLHIDKPGELEGIPVINESGSEIYVLPEEFDSLGRPGADAMRWTPQMTDEQGEI